MSILQSEIELVMREVERARAKHPAMASAHEGRSVIREECDELWSHVMHDTGHTADALKEARQVAAMGMRYAMDVCGWDAGRVREHTQDGVRVAFAVRKRNLSSAHEGHAFIMDHFSALFAFVASGDGKRAFAATTACRLAGAAIEFAIDICKES